MSAYSDEAARLAVLYAGMSDGELQWIASDSASLTEPAQLAISAELQKRALAIPEVSASPENAEEMSPMENDDLSGVVTIRKFRDLPEALLAKGSLESAGIECYLIDDNMVRMDWFISNLLGGVKLQVWPEDIAEATAILDMPIPEAIEVAGSGTYQQPHCPNCGSLDVTFAELHKPAAYVTAAVGLPMPLHRTEWKCHACGHEWKDTDTDMENEP